MIDPQKYLVGADATVEDVDLDLDDVHVRGQRITEQDARQLAERALREARRRNLTPGRKSLSGPGRHSPRVQFRVPDAILQQAEERAKIEGVSLSTLAREALERYLAS